LIDNATVLESALNGRAAVVQETRSSPVGMRNEIGFNAKLVMRGRLEEKDDGSEIPLDASQR
jgi:hypothetical protein